MIKKYNLFIFESYLEDIENIPMVADAEILESIVVDSDELMRDVKASKESFDGEPFNFDIRQFDDDYTIEQLRNNPDFNDSLSHNEMFISELSNTRDYDTFIDNDIKYMLIHKRDDRDLDKLEKLGDPLYIIFQTKDLHGDWKRDNIKIYKIEGNFNNFYRKLSSKTIELVKGDKKYIYISNGQNWILRNIENKDETFKDVMSNDEIKLRLKEGDVTITIVS